MRPPREHVCKHDLPGWAAGVLLAGLCLMGTGPGALGQVETAARFEEQIRPILEDHCLECHGNGVKKGQVELDRFTETQLQQPDAGLWHRVLRNVRAGLMPPAEKPRLTGEEMAALERWIKRDVLRLDPARPDPGRVTLRRLNRVEYRNTIRDLMGIEFATDEEFPPDDTGYGFDTIGEVLSVSPLLLEKYLQAAESIVARAVPRQAKVTPERSVRGNRFRRVEGGEGQGDRLSFYQPARLDYEVEDLPAGDYRIAWDLEIDGGFDYDPGRCRVQLLVDGREVWSEVVAWADFRRQRADTEVKLKAGARRLGLVLTPLVDASEQKEPLILRLGEVRLAGPLDPGARVHPANYTRFFERDEPPSERGAWPEYGREVLARFVRKAFRRPVEPEYLDRLIKLAERVWGDAGKGFEDGVAQAMAVVLASPRFVFRLEGTVPDPAGGPYAWIDEHALASRLSYFLWSTMPDEELSRLADEGKLRASLDVQVDRMLGDPRSYGLVRNFTGQWLQLRDVEGIAINARAILRREGKRGDFDLDGELRRLFRAETEMLFAGLLKENRSLLEMIDANYTYLNERLANYYQIPGVTVRGPEMRRVELPGESPRGGVLTQASVLLVTSNPTRTSPVKRGLFILENFLATPPPPPPAEVPKLEDAAKDAASATPTVRELMELHRADPLCASCHARMDPLGLALEEYNAMGQWRERERGQMIDTSGKLVTGETFRGVRELKRILVNERKRDLYHGMTEHLLTYALGRGLTPWDVETVDQIVAALERDGGAARTLVRGVIGSSAFQKRRVSGAAAGEASLPALGVTSDPAGEN